MEGAGGLYGVLGVSRNATDEEIRRAFRTIARTCHPDVAGGDPRAAQRFREARDAYEALIDPSRRAAHDRTLAWPKPRRSRHDDSIFRSFYRRASEGARRAAAEAAADADAGPASDPDLDDLFGDFGFGRGGRPRSRLHTPPPRAEPARGDDVSIDLHIPRSVARDGGYAAACYVRLRRVPTWRAGDPDPGVEPADDEQRLDVPAGTRHLAIRRYVGLGDAGAHGGPHGQLVVRFRLVDDPVGPEPPPGEHPRPPQVDVGVVDALLGGHVEVETPAGRVRVRVPPCTSSGALLRIRQRGAPSSLGERADHLVEVRVVMPPELDDPSRALVEELAARLRRA